MMSSPPKILISGAFGDSKYQFDFFERIASSLEQDGIQIERFNAFAFNYPNRGLGKLLERLVTIPARLFGFSKQDIRARLPWTPEGRRERALLECVKQFKPDMLMVIRGFDHRPETLQRCRQLGVKELVGWYVEGPTAPGQPEAESLKYDRYYCIHTEIAPTAKDRISHLPSYGLDQQTFYRLHFPRKVQQKIVFVGTPTERRIRHLLALIHLPLEIWGPNWSKVRELTRFHKGEFIWGEALNRLYNDSAIVLNVSSWDSHLSGMTQRILEIPASGAFMLTDDAFEIRQLFKVGQDMDVFDSPDRLKQQCEKYLNDSNLRETIAASGHDEALKQGDFTRTARVLAGLNHH